MTQLRFIFLSCGGKWGAGNRGGEVVKEAVKCHSISLHFIGFHYMIWFDYFCSVSLFFWWDGRNIPHKRRGKEKKRKRAKSNTKKKKEKKMKWRERENGGSKRPVGCMDGATWRRDVTGRSPSPMNWFTHTHTHTHTITHPDPCVANDNNNKIMGLKTAPDESIKSIESGCGRISSHLRPFKTVGVAMRPQSHVSMTLNIEIYVDVWQRRTSGRLGQWPAASARPPARPPAPKMNRNGITTEWIM